MLRQFFLATLFASTIALPAYSDTVSPDPTISPNPVASPKLPDGLLPEDPDAIQGDRVNRPSKTLPTALLNIIQRDIQRRWRVPVRTLKLSAAQPRTFDSCLGIPPVNGVCGKIAIAGWQVVIQGQNRNWVYQVNNSGKLLAYNALASQPRPNANSLTPKFIVQRSIVPVIGKDIIFQSATVTGNSRAYYAFTLSDSGVITRRMLNRSDRPDSKPTIVKTITPPQVQQFKTVLANNQFSHFDRLSYFDNDAIAADAMSLQFSRSSQVTEYTLSSKIIPKKLAAIADAWSALLK